MSKFNIFLYELLKYFDIPVFKGMHLHVDNDSCCIYGQFETFADHYGIILDKSVKYVAQTNSIAEVVWRETHSECPTPSCCNPNSTSSSGRFLYFYYTRTGFGSEHLKHN